MSNQHTEDMLPYWNDILPKTKTFERLFLRRKCLTELYAIGKTEGAE